MKRWLGAWVFWLRWRLDKTRNPHLRGKAVRAIAAGRPTDEWELWA